jgi:PadR family transcriptional regulator PadR
MRNPFHNRRPPAAASTSEWTSQLRRGVLELCILQVLGHEPSYGYEIVTTLNELGPLAAGENTVYPLLRRLKADGLLETFTRESPAGPARQYYRLTAEGRKRVTALSKEWAAMVEAVARCIRQGDRS